MSDEDNKDAVLTNGAEGKLSEFISKETPVSNDANDEKDTSIPMPDELTMLKSRAKMMGLQFSGNIGLEALKAKVATAMAPKEPEVSDEDPVMEDAQLQENVTIPPVVQHTTQTLEIAPAVPAKPKKVSLRKHLQDKHLRLIRIRITNLDPKKASLPGEIITVANEYIGTVRKYVPFGEKTDNGYHVPFVIYNFLKDRKFLSIKSVKIRGKEQTENQWVKEFSLEILEPLTVEELAKLGAAQSASQGLDN